MKYAKLNQDGFPISFYSDDIHGKAIPEAAIELTDAQWRDLVENDGRRRVVDGKVIAYDPPAPPLTIDDYARAIQRKIDATAGERGYDSAATCASYVLSTVPNWRAEAQALIAWRDAVWAYAYAELAKVQQGARAQPTVYDFLAEFPVVEWPKPEVDAIIAGF